MTETIHRTKAVEYSQENIVLVENCANIISDMCTYIFPEAWSLEFSEPFQIAEDVGGDQALVSDKIASPRLAMRHIHGTTPTISPSIGIVDISGPICAKGPGLSTRLTGCRLL